MDNWMMMLGKSNEAKSFIRRAREGCLFDPATGQQITEARAAEILRDLHHQLTRTDGKAIRQDQVATYLQDFTELPVTATQLHQATLEGKSLGTDNTEKVRELRSVMTEVEIELAAGNLQPTSVQAHIQQIFPTFKYDLEIQDVFIDRYRELTNNCAHSTSFEQLEQFLERSRARFSPGYTNDQIIAVIRRMVGDARAGKIKDGSVSRSLVRGGFIPNKIDNPIYLALHRLEQSDPQIQAQRQQGPETVIQSGGNSPAEAPVEAAKYSLSLSIVGANNVEVETNPKTSVEIVKLTAPDGTNFIRIPLSRLQAAFTAMESITHGTRIGSARDIYSLMLKYDLNTGKPSHLLVGGKDILQNNTTYDLSISGEALTKLLDILKPPDQSTEGQPIPVVETISLNVIGIAKRIKDLLLGHDSKDEITQNETSVEIPKPGISTLKAPEHFIQDRSGSGDVSYEVTGEDGEKVQAEGIRIVINDGSGGSLAENITEDQGRSVLIGGKAKAGLDAILQASNLSPAEAVRAAHRKIKDMNDSFSTVMVADVVIEENGKGKLRFAGLGDTSVVAYRQDKPFDHRRSELSGAFVSDFMDSAEKARILADPSHMQIQNLQHNGALIEKIYGSGRKVETAALDSTRVANGIYLNFGDKTKQDVHPVNFTVDLEELDADFILVMSDGAQPNSMLATDPRVDLSEDIAAELTNNPDGAESMKNQPRYVRKVQSIMSELTEGKIDVKTASGKITSAARNTLGDKDDISVAIIDVRQFRKTKP